MKNALNSWLKKWLLNEQGEISFSKVGVEIVALAGIIVLIPTLDTQVIVIPAAVIDIAKIVGLFGAGTALVGFRNAGKK